MDIVVRTPHGNADVSVGDYPPTATLGDLIGVITGQATPRLARVDGRSVSCAAPLDDVALAIGSVVTTDPPPPAPVDESIELTQVAGLGAGRSIRLDQGRFRLGPGRRIGADELAEAPVESTVVELIVEPRAESEVIVVPGDRPAHINGSQLEGPSEWDEGVLTIGTRVFEWGAPTSLARLTPTPDGEGQIPFNRPPRRRSSRVRRPVVDAVRDTASAASTLWERRGDHNDAYVVPFGIALGVDGAEPASVNLAAEPGVAIVGSDEFRSALARTLIVEATTLHGPADLDVVIVTEPHRIATWDWAKWIPHARRSGRPAIWCHHRDVARWIATMVDDTESRVTDHLTLLIVDHPTLWNRPDSPLRPLVSHPPATLRLLALCPKTTDAPAMCTAAITESTGRGARMESFGSDDNADAVLPALTEIGVAADIARGMSSLIDLDAPPARRLHVSGDHIDLLTLFDLEDATPTTIADQWSGFEGVDDSHGDVDIPIGISDGERWMLPSVDARTVRMVTGSLVDGWDIATTIALGRCIGTSPDSLWVLALGTSDDPRVAALSSLPHAVQPHDANTPLDVQRMSARIHWVLAHPDGPDTVLLIVDSDGSFDETDLATLMEAGDGLEVIMITDQTVTEQLEHVEVIRLDEADGQTIATIVDQAGDVGSPITVFRSERSAAQPEIDLRPAVIGRALTPLERRVDRLANRRPTRADPKVITIIDLLRDAAELQTSVGPSRVLLPPPLPSHVEIDDLLAAHPGDGVPIGLVDNPATLDLEPWWWQPGAGSVLVFGPRRSGVDTVLTTLIVGIADRFATADITIVAIEPSASRRRALLQLEHATTVVPGTSADEVSLMLDLIESEMERRHDAGNPSPERTGPRMVVFIGDLSLLRRQVSDARLRARLDDVLAAASRAGSGLDVVAYASDLDSAHPLVDSTIARLVGGSSDRAVDEVLGVEAPAGDERARCRSFPGGDVIQLATSSQSLEELLASRLAPDSR